MSRTPKKQPTSAELEILQVLWSRGQATVRDVLIDLTARREVDLPPPAATPTSSHLAQDRRARGRAGCAPFSRC